jgi:hypothetical protein
LFPESCQRSSKALRAAGLNISDSPAGTCDQVQAPCFDVIGKLDGTRCLLE